MAEITSMFSVIQTRKNIQGLQHLWRKPLYRGEIVVTFRWCRIKVIAVLVLQMHCWINNLIYIHYFKGAIECIDTIF